jgi:lactate dehydrogenase-like 2-hydroxyacid dehydrogenase
VDDLPPPRDELLRRIAGTDGSDPAHERVDDEFLDAAGPALKVVSNYAVGFDNIDVAACARRGVAVGNARGLTETTADLACAADGGAPDVAEGDRHVRAGRWKAWGRCSSSGRTSTARPSDSSGSGGSARRWQRAGVRMRVLYHDVQPLPDEVTAPLGATYLPLEALLAQSDFVSLHVNLSDVTRHLINVTTLSWMKPTAVLINTSRGPVVDQPALADALRDGVIWAAARDVTDPEPIPMDDPLLALDNCLIVPHRLARRGRRARMAEMAAATLIAGVLGQPLPTPVRTRRRTGAPTHGRPAVYQELVTFSRLRTRG